MPKPGPSATGPSLSVREAAEKLSGLITEVGEEHPTEPEAKEPDAIPAPTPSEAPPQTSDTEPPAIEEPDSEDAIEVTVDGERTTVGELKRGSLREADYTRKTQALAQEKETYREQVRRELEASVQAERAEYTQGIQEIRQALESLTGEPDWVERRKVLAPEEFLKEKADWEASKAQTDKLKAEQARVQEIQRADEIKRYQGYVRAEQDKLKAAWPDWTDPEKAKVEAAKLRAHLKTYGFSDEEIGGVVDHRAVLLARDAMSYRELQRAPSAKTQAKVAPIRTAKPGAAPPPPPPNAHVQKLIEQSAKTGKARDVAKAIEALLE